MRNKSAQTGARPTKNPFLTKLCQGAGSYSERDEPCPPLRLLYYDCFTFDGGRKLPTELARSALVQWRDPPMS